MRTNVNFGNDMRLQVQEDVDTVLAGLAGGGYVKVTCLHHLHKTPSGSAWVNAAQVRFVNQLP